MQESAIRFCTGQMDGSLLYAEQVREFSQLEHFRKFNVRASTQIVPKSHHPQTPRMVTDFLSWGNTQHGFFVESMKR
jgi:hypothetical protein